MTAENTKSTRIEVSQDRVLPIERWSLSIFSVSLSVSSAMSSENLYSLILIAAVFRHITCDSDITALKCEDDFEETLSRCTLASLRGTPYAERCSNMKDVRYSIFDCKIYVRCSSASEMVASYIDFS